MNCEVSPPSLYDGRRIDAGYRIEMLAEGCIIIENKAVDKLLSIHEAQLPTCLKLRDCRLEGLLNWNVKLMQEGMQRMRNNRNTCLHAKA
ncbi:MAG: GxxExxY protein [candidate division KSB1 bacterium]|nr:GxxExxY protein [candidate division KSB1 bacterium]MDZ7274309.1 GxxExxY protein [candidate division KSB1 bacterium]MDZ7287169.1 GxxExxY protein [candidate division KSB1 bacterium]MDZ7296906.1 GxxExxY protein [candidate division KSB1 bacterium]MDZ7309494.1 GxxExxY protein [candidate division KSB1 bacterium]